MDHQKLHTFMHPPTPLTADAAAEAGAKARREGLVGIPPDVPKDVKALWMRGYAAEQQRIVNAPRLIPVTA